MHDIEMKRDGGALPAKPAPILIHVQTNPAAAEIYRVTRDMLDARLEDLPELRRRLLPSFGETADQLEAGLAQAEVLFIHGRLVLSSLTGLAPHLKWIQSTGAGVDRLLPQVPSTIAVTTTSACPIVLNAAPAAM